MAEKHPAVNLSADLRRYAAIFAMKADGLQDD